MDLTFLRRRLREEHGLSQEIVSGLAGIGRTHLSAIERGEREPTLEAFYRIRQLPSIKKKPSTSEIIDWIRALVHGGVDPSRVVKEVPYLGVLLKKNEDMDALRRTWK